MRRSPALLPAFLFLLIPALEAETHVVLAFANTTNNARLDWIGESIAESIGDALAREGLLVLDREIREEAYQRLSIRRYAMLTRATVVKLGEALDAGYIIHGYYAISGQESVPAKQSIRIAARVLDLKRLRQSNEFSVTAGLADLASVQAGLAWEIFRFLRPQTTRSEQDFRRIPQSIRVDAMESYIRGLLAATDEQRHRLLAQAARLDPAFSQPRFHLGRYHWRQKNCQVASQWLNQVTPADPHFREGMFLLGLCRYQMGDFAGAEETFGLLAKEIPINEVLNNLGAAQARRERPGALEQFQKALEGDESDPSYHFNVGYALWRAGRFEEAADRFRAVLDRNSQDAEATLMLGRCLKRTPARPIDVRAEPGPRLKQNFDEAAYLQLREMVEPGRE